MNSYSDWYFYGVKTQTIIFLNLSHSARPMKEICVQHVYCDYITIIITCEYYNVSQKLQLIIKKYLLCCITGYIMLVMALNLLVLQVVSVGLCLSGLCLSQVMSVAVSGAEGSVWVRSLSLSLFLCLLVVWSGLRQNLSWVSSCRFVSVRTSSITKVAMRIHWSEDVLVNELEEGHWTASMPLCAVSS